MRENKGRERQDKTYIPGESARNVLEVLTLQANSMVRGVWTGLLLTELWQKVYWLTLCLPRTNPPSATLFWGTMELGRHLVEICSTRCIFLPVNRMENPKKEN